MLVTCFSSESAALYGYIYFVMFFFPFCIAIAPSSLTFFLFFPSFLLTRGGGCRGAVYSTFLLLHVSAEGLTYIYIYILIYMTEKTFDV